MNNDNSVMNTTIISLAKLAAKIVMTKLIVDGFVKLYTPVSKKVDDIIDVSESS